MDTIKCPTIYKSLLTALCFGVLVNARAQHNHKTQDRNVSAPLTFSHVLSQSLADSALADYKMESSVMTVAAGAIDTVSHRHDSELFGYVLEGQVQIALETKELKSFSAGQMFYERRNVLHTITKNPDSKKGAKVLLIFIIKNGRKGYTAEYAQKH
jgi:quercetin dioxygenase-like cupin family protein